MAAMALSTVAWAVIITICGRSASGMEAVTSRTRSSPERSGMRLSTTRTSKIRSLSRRLASRPPLRQLDADLGAGSGPALDGNGTAQAVHHVPGDGEPEAGPAAAGREVG